jgi:hypothetical protein
MSWVAIFTVSILDDVSAQRALSDAVGSFNADEVSSIEAAVLMQQLGAAFREPLTLTRSCEHIFGELTGEQVLRLRLHDLIVHTWDVAQTVNPPAKVPLGSAQGGLTELAAQSR